MLFLNKDIKKILNSCRDSLNIYHIDKNLSKLLYISYCVAVYYCGV